MKRRDEDRLTPIGWFLVNIAPFCVVLCGIIGVFDHQRQAEWASAAAVLAAFCGGRNVTPALDGLLKQPKKQPDETEQ
jgi:hypothetical protein